MGIVMCKCNLRVPKYIKMAFCAKNFVRSLSTSANALQLVKPKVQLYTLEGRYACALYSAASKKNALPKVEKDLNDFNALVKKDEPLRTLLQNPLIKKSLKTEALTSVLGKTKANPLTVNFFCAMAENNRLSKLSEVVDSFGVIMAAERGEVVCEVTTAKALDAASMKEVRSALQGFLKKGETLKLTTKVDPAIIGGMLVVVGDKFVDMSIASKVTRYTNAISGAL